MNLPIKTIKFQTTNRFYENDKLKIIFEITTAAYWPGSTVITRKAKIPATIWVCEVFSFV
jgi:hypothetical protein